MGHSDRIVSAALRTHPLAAMTARPARRFILAGKILSAIFLVVGGAGALSAAPFADQQLVYNASFGNGSLESSVDHLGIGALKIGDTQIAGSNPTWTPQNGTIILGITRPANLSGGSPVAAGLFATPVDFNVGSLFGLRATFLAPIGPHNIADVWAVTLEARTGGEPDFFIETRVAATLQIRAGGARLNVPGSSVPANLRNVPQDVYDAIFEPTDPQPFTLELLVDRVTGNGKASLQVGDAVFSHNFQFAAFQASSGPAITAVGPSIVIANSPGQTASVQVRDFQIFTGKQDAGRGSGCPPGWAEFSCRVPPPN